MSGARGNVCRDASCRARWSPVAQPPPPPYGTQLIGDWSPHVPSGAG